MALARTTRRRLPGRTDGGRLRRRDRRPRRSTRSPLRHPRCRRGGGGVGFARGATKWMRSRCSVSSYERRPHRMATRHGRQVPLLALGDVELVASAWDRRVPCSPTPGSTSSIAACASRARTRLGNDRVRREARAGRLAVHRPVGRPRLDIELLRTRRSLPRPRRRWRRTSPPIRSRRSQALTNGSTTWRAIVDRDVGRVRLTRPRPSDPDDLTTPLTGCENSAEGARRSGSGCKKTGGHAWEL